MDIGTRQDEGFQQMLLILAYLHTHKGSVLLIDEPDAHLEVLRQKQVYEMLKDVATANDSQVVVATHSEVILDDAIETNLTLLINGTAADLATMQDVRNSLRTYGAEYYKGEGVSPILYVEGSRTSIRSRRWLQTGTPCVRLPLQQYQLLLHAQYCS